MRPMHSIRPLPGWQAVPDARAMRQARAGRPTHPTMHAPPKRDASEKLPMRVTRLMRMT
ncbi:hypothetical protein BCO37747_05344 [Burkholderia contaminans]|nr:hypothetical protein BCO37747_05344 [Burkholderia contaminans]